MFIIAGGRPGSLGLNLLIQNSGKTVNLGSKATVTVNAGVRHSEYFVILFNKNIKYFRNTTHEY